MSLLTLGDVALTRGDTHVLGGVSLHVEEGEFVSILGPSGAGKSTIFELLIGGLSPDVGEIAFEGRPLDPGDSPFAFMPQRDALMPWRRIMDNVTLDLKVQGLSRRAARERVRPLFPASVSTASSGTGPRSSPAACASGPRSSAPSSRIGA